MVSFVDHIFPVLLKTLSDSSDEVLILNLQVLAEICCPPDDDDVLNTGVGSGGGDLTQTTRAIDMVQKKCDKLKERKSSLAADNEGKSPTLHSKFGNSNPHFKSFILSLLKLFRADRNLLNTKGSFIIRYVLLRVL